MKSIHNKKVQGAVLVFVVACILFVVGISNNGGRHLTMDSYLTQIESLIRKQKGHQKQWDLLLGDMQGTWLENPRGTRVQGIAFVDTCNQEYIEKITLLGQSFIELQTEFIDLEADVEKGTVIPDYQQYATYFEIFNLIGEQLQQFASVIQSGDYKTAIVCLEQLQKLNAKIPVIE